MTPFPAEPRIKYDQRFIAKPERENPITGALISSCKIVVEQPVCLGGVGFATVPLRDVDRIPAGAAIRALEYST